MQQPPLPPLPLPFPAACSRRRPCPPRHLCHSHRCCCRRPQTPRPTQQRQPSRVRPVHRRHRRSANPADQPLPRHRPSSTKPLQPRPPAAHESRPSPAGSWWWVVKLLWEEMVPSHHLRRPLPQQDQPRRLRLGSVGDKQPAYPVASLPLAPPQTEPCRQHRVRATVRHRRRWLRGRRLRTQRRSARRRLLLPRAFPDSNPEYAHDRCPPFPDLSLERPGRGPQHHRRRAQGQARPAGIAEARRSR